MAQKTRSATCPSSFFRLLAAALPLAGLAIGQAGPAPSFLTVAYTGRTLGYFRLPETQPRVGFDRCVADVAAASGPTREFLKALRDQGAQLTVGMGDNFAVDLNSRTFVDNVGGVPDREPKDLWTWDYLSTTQQWIPDSQVKNNKALADSLAAGNGQIPADNVGCLIRYARYDAIVPGKHDFYFGPDRLLMLARFLMKDQSQDFPPVPMLAANMAIITTEPNAPPRIPDYQRQRDSGGRNQLGYQVIPAPKDNEAAIQVDLPDVVLPYYRQIVIHNAFDIVDSGHAIVALKNLPDGTIVTHPGGFPKTGASPATTAALQPPKAASGPAPAANPVTVAYKFDKVQFCPAAKGAERDPYNLDLSRCETLDIDADALKGADLNNDLFYSLAAPILQPNSDWGVCLHLLAPQPSGMPPLFCQLFSVHAPFFQYPRGSGSPVPPYATKIVNGANVAIFGVVDPSLSSSVGRLNYAWLNSKPKYETRIEVADPGVRSAR